MADKDKLNRQSEGVLQETFAAPEAKPSTSLSYNDKLADPYSPEVKQRRERLIKEINAGWSEESDRALSAIATRYTRNADTH